mmetsp:Transcript_10140/g.20367  ORF Transcript_10140/g.20367 Transcript_10140/m.20367 type:complete len:133 (-) Transcript_10140:528-926(-)
MSGHVPSHITSMKKSGPAGFPDEATSRSCSAHRCCTSSLRRAAGRPAPGTRTVSQRARSSSNRAVGAAVRPAAAVGRGHLEHRVGPRIGPQAELLRPRHVGGGRDEGGGPVLRAAAALHPNLLLAQRPLHFR